MKTSRILGAAGAFLSAALLLSFAPSAHAATFPDLTYTVTLDVSSLNLLPNAPFSLDLQLITGSGNVANTVTLSNFTFTGGTASATPNFINGNESGSFASSVTLKSIVGGTTDNEYQAAFSAGVTQISFKVDQTPNSEVVGTGTATPDQFNVVIYGADGMTPVATTDPSGSDTLVSSVLSSDATLAKVQFSTIEAPEPSSVAMLLVGACSLLGLGALNRRRLA